MRKDTKKHSKRKKVNRSECHLHPFIPKTGKRLLLRKEMRPHVPSRPGHGDKVKNKSCAQRRQMQSSWMNE